MRNAEVEYWIDAVYPLHRLGGWVRGMPSLGEAFRLGLRTKMGASKARNEERKR